MSFIGFEGKGYQTFIARSDDLITWTYLGLAMGYGPDGRFDHGGVVLGAYLYESYDILAPRLLKRHNGQYWSLYGAYPRQGGYELRPGYEGVATSDDGLNWKGHQEGPILSVFQKDRKQWEKDCIYQPWLVQHGDRFYDFYNAARGGKEQTGIATSPDLVAWKRYEHNPVVPLGKRGSYNQDFSSDPKVFHDGDHWVMFFFGVGHGGAHVMVAFSTDLLHWTVNPDPIVKRGGHPGGLDAKYAHKVSLVWCPESRAYYMFYNAVDAQDRRGIALLTSNPND
jgi:beta-xylosidase